MKKLLQRFHRDEEGAGLVEYALLVVIIALAAVVGMGVLGTGLNTVFNAIGLEIGGATVPVVP